MSDKLLKNSKFIKAKMKINYLVLKLDFLLIIFQNFALSLYS